MGKLLKKLAIVAACLGSSVAVAEAQSTSNGLLSANKVMQTVSLAEAQAILTSLNLQVAVERQGPDQPPFLVARTTGGGTFFSVFHGCADGVNVTGCRAAAHFTASTSQGMQYSDLNDFNGQSEISKAVHDVANDLVVFGHAFYLDGGIGEANYKVNVLLFLKDMQQHTERQQSSATAVSFGISPEADSKISSVTSVNVGSFSAGSKSSTTVSDSRPTLIKMSDGTVLTQQKINAAVNNTWTANYIDDVTGIEDF